MAQAAAVPKLARARTLMLAPFMRPGGLIPSQSAALDYRARPLAQPASPQVTFLTPLVGQHQVTDWAVVETRLAATLNSFLAQTDPNWTVLVCGQDRPNTLPKDPRIRFLPFETEVEGNDKWAKLRALCTALPALGGGDGYVMPFDADDLLHQDVVAHMVRARAARGFVVSHGLVANLGTGAIGEARAQSLFSPGQKAFWKLCGSCAAFRWDESPEATAFVAEATQHEHRMFPYLARLAGRPLAPFPFAAALYALNHGENFGKRRGRVSFKARFVERFAIQEPARKAELLAAFPPLDSGP